MKSGCKAKLVDWLKSTMDLDIDQDALIDIQTLGILELRSTSCLAGVLHFTTRAEAKDQTNSRVQEAADEHPAS